MTVGVSESGIDCKELLTIKYSPVFSEWGYHEVLRLQEPSQAEGKTTPVSNEGLNTRQGMRVSSTRRILFFSRLSLNLLNL